MRKLKHMKRLAVSIILCTTMIFLVSGCGKKKEKVSLALWGSEEDQGMLKEMVQAFKDKYAEDAELDIKVSEENEVTCKETVLTNPKAAADVYIFADDQFNTLCKEGALHEITEDADTVIEENGGKDSAAVQAASYNDKLYSYPMTASNGYFLYYNKKYFSEEDVKSFDKMLEIAKKNGKKIAMDFTGGWYLYSFFKGAGLDVEINDDGLTNTCNWNTTEGKYKGIDVAKAMCAIASNKGFLNCGDKDFVEGAKDGSIIAGINGAWNAADMQKAYGNNYAATKLPEYTIAGDLVQMHSFMGFKLVGVNAYSKNDVWAQRLAQWITNEENQLKRFKKNGECPSNVKAAASDDVVKSPAIAALAAQSEFAHIQRVSDSFWMPVYVYGTTITAGNLDKRDLQGLLDQMVADITAPPKKTAKKTE